MAMPSQKQKESEKRTPQSPWAKVSYEVRVRGARMGRSSGGGTPY